MEHGRGAGNVDGMKSVSLSMPSSESDELLQHIVVLERMREDLRSSREVDIIGRAAGTVKAGRKALKEFRGMAMKRIWISGPQVLALDFILQFSRQKSFLGVWTAYWTVRPIPRDQSKSDFQPDRTHNWKC